mmetsp:Transcript_56556/g.132129  ORF Transcript_56556/g.132129 Transcript_56556/m.132129 type:complete len:217 (-) Transcript_56556:19-669(-)
MIGQMPLHLVDRWRFLELLHHLLDLLGIVIADTDRAHLPHGTKLSQAVPSVQTLLLVQSAALVRKVGRVKAREMDQNQIHIIDAQLLQGLVHHHVFHGRTANGTWNLGGDKDVLPLYSGLSNSSSNVWLCAIVVSGVQMTPPKLQPLRDALCDGAVGERTAVAAECNHGHVDALRNLNRWHPDCKSSGRHETEQCQAKQAHGCHTGTYRNLGQGQA